MNENSAAAEEALGPPRPWMEPKSMAVVGTPPLPSTQCTGLPGQVASVPPEQSRLRSVIVAEPKWRTTIRMVWRARTSTSHRDDTVPFAIACSSFGRIPGYALGMTSLPLFT